VLAFFAKLAPCLVGMAACGSSGACRMSMADRHSATRHGQGRLDPARLSFLTRSKIGNRDAAEVASNVITAADLARPPGGWFAANK
jgi:hypothetical protein